eukprot:1751354-Pyramimonas_sp.AAC.1
MQNLWKTRGDPPSQVCAGADARGLNRHARVVSGSRGMCRRASVMYPKPLKHFQAALKNRGAPPATCACGR